MSFLTLQPVLYTKKFWVNKKRLPPFFHRKTLPGFCKGGFPLDRSVRSKYFITFFAGQSPVRGLLYRAHLPCLLPSARKEEPRPRGFFSDSLPFFTCTLSAGTFLKKGLCEGLCVLAPLHSPQRAHPVTIIEIKCAPPRRNHHPNKSPPDSFFFSRVNFRICG